MLKDSKIQSHTSISDEKLLLWLLAKAKAIGLTAAVSFSSLRNAAGEAKR